MLLVPDMGQFADGVCDYTVFYIIILDNVSEWVKPDIFRGKPEENAMIVMANGCDALSVSLASSLAFSQLISLTLAHFPSLTFNICSARPTS